MGRAFVKARLIIVIDTMERSQLQAGNDRSILDLVIYADNYKQLDLIFSTQTHDRNGEALFCFYASLIY